MVRNGAALFYYLSNVTSYCSKISEFYKDVSSHEHFLIFFCISFPIGIQLHDTCGSIRLTQKHLFQIITATREPNNVLSLPTFTRESGVGSSFALGPPLLGMLIQHSHLERFKYFSYNTNVYTTD